MTVLAGPRRRPSRPALGVLAALWVLVALQSLVVRPALNARTDIVLAGGDPGESPLHVVYVGLSVLLVVGLVAAIVVESTVKRREAAT